LYRADGTMESRDRRIFRNFIRSERARARGGKGVPGCLGTIIITILPRNKRNLLNCGHWRTRPVTDVEQHERWCERAFFEFSLPEGRFLLERERARVRERERERKRERERERETLRWAYSLFQYFPRRKLHSACIASA